MSTIAITGSVSGIGAATAQRLTGQGHRVLGIDVNAADVNAADVQCDLGTKAGRSTAIERITELCDGRLDALVTCAGMAGTSTAPAEALVSVNYFGTTELLVGLRPVLANAERAAVVCVSSNSTTCQPDWPVELAEACLNGDEARARDISGEYNAIETYPATKAAIAWYVREQSGTPEWIGSGIRLNAIAPGHVETAMTAEIRADPDLGALLDAFPIPRGVPGRPEEVASLIEFLIGPGSALLCGSVVYVDGGTDAMLRTKAWPSVWSP